MSKSSRSSTPPAELGSTDFEVVDVRGDSNTALWDRLVEAAPDAWLWHGRRMRDYVLAAAAERDPCDLSFAVFRDGEPVALAPLIVENFAVGAYSGRDAAYYGGPLPWPCATGADAVAAENFALAELLQRARAAGVGRLRLQLSPPEPSAAARKRFGASLRAHGLLGTVSGSHLVELGATTLASVRERYRRYQRKFALEFDLQVLDGDAIDAAVEEAYFRLHVADAGGQFRPRESYARMADIARAGEGIFVMARHLETGAPAGVLVVLLAKQAAYDASVCVDPAYRARHVSVLLKWAAIEALISRGARRYELGAKAEFADWQTFPSRKNYDISFFKEGWARGAEKSVLLAETYFDRGCLDAVAQTRVDAIAGHCGL